MKIQYASDLHLEFPDNKLFLKNNPLQVDGDILVLAGDIVPFAVMNQHDDFFDFVSDHFENTYWIPGNHEYYHFDLAEKQGEFHEKIRSNVHLMNNQTVQLDGVRLLLSTLWSKISPTNAWKCEQWASDFHVINYENRTFNSNDFNRLHRENLDFITAELSKETNDKTIVVTHHVPSFKNYPTEYLSSSVNEVFAVELFDLILDTQPSFWVYGHHHRNVPAFKIGSTELLTNQLGYVKYKELRNFSLNKVIDTEAVS